MKAIIFTLDAIVAFGIVIAIISGLIFFRTEIVSPYLAAQRLHSVSEDMIGILTNSRLRDVTNQSLLNQYISDGTLEEKDLDKNTIDIIGALWSAEKIEEAANITKSVLDGFIPNNTGYEFLINGDSIYNSSDTNRPKIEDASLEISSGRVVSGYEKYKPTEGYVARAIATSIKKNTTLVLMGDVISSSVRKLWGGNNQNTPNISYVFDLPEDATIIDAYWFIEAAWVDNKFKAYLNGVYIPGSDATGNKLLEDIEPFIQPGHNEGNVVYRYGAGGRTGGDDGATHLVVIYNTSLLSTLKKFDKIYFQSVISNCSIEYKKSVFVLGKIHNLSVRLNLTNETQVNDVTLKFMWNGEINTIGTKVVNNGIVEWNDTEIRNLLNSIGITYDILDGRYFWFIVHVDTYNEREDLGYERRIVGEDSYVYVSYSTNEAIYNYIDISRTIDDYSYSEPDAYGFYKYVRWNFNLTNKIPLISKWQFAWLYYDGSNPKQVARANDITLYNHDPANASSDPLIIEFARFGYNTDPDGIQINGDNKFELNFSNGYAVKPQNSLGETTFLIPASVGYGDLFVNESDAIIDAETRLINLLGEDIEAININVDSISVAGVPYMWGPVSARVRVWL